MNVHILLVGIGNNNRAREPQAYFKNEDVEDIYEKPVIKM